MITYNNRHINSEIKAQAQKLPISKKNKEWREKQVDYVISASRSMKSGSEKKRMEENYKLYLGEVDLKKLKYVIDPFNQKDGFPAVPHNVNIVKSKVDLLVGEEINTAVKPSAYCTSAKASEQINKQKIDAITQYMLSSLMSSMSEEGLASFQQQLQSGEIKDPKDILGLSPGLTFKSAIEESARTLMEYLYEYLNIKDIFTSGFFDLLINGKQVYYAGIISGEPNLERVSPDSIDYVTTTAENRGVYTTIEDSEMICRTSYMTPTEIYDRLYHIATESDLDRILEMSGDGNSTFPSKDKGGPLDYNKVDFKFESNELNGMGGKLPVYHVLWRSFAKIGFLTYLDETGNPQSTIVSEDYVSNGNEQSLTWEWIPEIWEGYRVGDDIYIGIKPLEYQNINEENLLTQKMPYFGIELAPGSSIVDVLKPLQYLYIIIWYRLELALARDNGRVLNMDIRKIPKSLGIDPAKWLHLLSSVGVNFYNPSDTGFDNNEDSIRDTSTGITGTDLSMSNVIAEYVNILERIESVAEQISGITRQRSGFTKSSEYVGAIEQSIGQSSLITEPIFWAHESCKRSTLRYLVNMSKDVFYAMDKKFLSYITSDGARAAGTLDDDFFFEDYDVFISSSRKESKDLALIKSLYQAAMQNGTSLSDVATIISLNSVEAIKGELRRLDEEKAQSEQAQMQQEQQMQERILQSKEQADALANELEMMKMDLEKYKIDSTNQTKIAVAELQALGFANNNSGSPSGDITSEAEESQLEIAKTAESQIKALRERGKALLDLEEMKLKSKKLDNDIKVSNEKLKLESEKLSIERKKVKSYGSSKK